MRSWFHNFHRNICPIFKIFRQPYCWEVSPSKFFESEHIYWLKLLQYDRDDSRLSYNLKSLNLSYDILNLVILSNLWCKSFLSYFFILCIINIFLITKAMFPSLIFCKLLKIYLSLFWILEVCWASSKPGIWNIHKSINFMRF